MCNCSSLFSRDNFSNIAFRWTPRVIISTLAGYYSLGIAYERGVMALIDRMAIRILFPWVGYAGLGAVMPTVQWYTAWGVRIAVTLTVAFLYTLFEKAIAAAYKNYCSRQPQGRLQNELEQRNRQVGNPPPV